jgi:hypothetical protein
LRRRRRRIDGHADPVFDGYGYVHNLPDPHVDEHTEPVLDTDRNTDRNTGLDPHPDSLGDRYPQYPPLPGGDSSRPGRPSRRHPIDLGPGRG